jgi:hypothetical protein
MSKLKKYGLVFTIVAVATMTATASPSFQVKKVYAAVENSVETDLKGTPWENLKVPMGTKFSIRKDSNGKEFKSLEFPGGVSIYETEHGIVSVDNSGYGAVMCAWGIYSNLRNAMDICPESLDENLKKQIDIAIQRINDFIIANSLSPVTQEQLEERSRKDLKDWQNRRSKMSEEMRNKECSGDIVNIIQSLKNRPTKELQDSVDKLLSIPRPPVINPCL